MAGKGGGAWKVAYADFVTAMMAFFLVMWITAQNQPVKEAIAQYFQDPFAFSTKAGGVDSPLPAWMEGNSPGARGGPSRHRGRGNGSGASREPQADDKRDGIVVRDPHRLVLQHGDRSYTGTTILFSDDSADLDETASARLDELAPLLMGKVHKIEVRGHTSGRPLPAGHPFKDAWQLSYARCVAAQRYLEEKGIEPRRVRLSQAASFEPPSLSSLSQGLAGDRVEVRLLDEIVEPPSQASGGGHPSLPRHTAEPSGTTETN